MSTDVTITMTNELSRDVTYYLGHRYGSRKFAKTLVKCAVLEAIHAQVKKELKEVEEAMNAVE